MKVINFAKFHGLGNDFILIDNTQSSEPIITPAQAIQLCDRNFGIGGDGVIMALPCQHDCAFTMRIFNSDGSEPQMCGNGIRCLAKFLQVIERMEVQSDVDYEYRIWTKAGVISPRINADGSVTVDMGEPFLTPDLVPTLLAPNKDYLIVKDGGEGVRVSIVVDAKVALEEGYSVQATAVGMGNPHSVTFVDSLERMLPSFEVIGPAVESCTSAYPQRVNAEFVEVLSRSHLRMKVWERGAGPTLACGTGACAVVVAGVLSGRSERQCTVTLPGGDLLVHWDSRNNRVYMTGPAVEVFRGTVKLSDC